jgi:hypothetical protein
MVVQACNLSTWEAETGESCIQGQFGIHIETLSQKNKRKKKNVGRVQSHWNAHALLVGVYRSPTIFENSLTASHKIKHRLP